MMRRNTWLAFSLLALATLAAVGWTARAQGVSRTAWEYKVVNAYASMPPKLNELGAEGWELVWVMTSEERHGNVVNVKHDFYLKRAR